MEYDGTATGDGVVLLCDQAGAVLEVLRDDVGITGGRGPGQLLIGVADRQNTGKLLNFLVELKRHGSVLDWEINVIVGDKVTTLHFGGVVFDEKMMVFAAGSRNGILDIYDGIMKINNEQANALRSAIKEQTALTRVQEQKDRALYDEISRLNNELVTLQRELARKNVELAKLNKLKDQFLGMASHDLRSPLGHIITYSDFLLDELASTLTVEQMEFMSIIRSSSQFMLGLVENLLDIARIESGRLELELRPVDLHALVEHNVMLHRPLAARKQIEITLDRDGDLPPTPVDPDRFEQVLNNLISNAVKFSNPGSAVEVRIKRDGDHVLLAVQDTGVGIPADQIDRLFKPFGKVSSRGTKGEKSTGLGLAIVKKIVQEHNGQIRVESESGKGSTFYVSLPIQSRPMDTG